MTPAYSENTAMNDAATIRELEERRYRAMRDGDTRVLETLLADEMLYVHSNTVSDSKTSLLAKITNEELRCDGMRHHVDDPVIVAGDTGIVTGRVTGTVHVRGVAVALCNRALAVWARQPGGWRMVAFQATPIPA